MESPIPPQKSARTQSQNEVRTCSSTCYHRAHLDVPTCLCIMPSCRCIFEIYVPELTLILRLHTLFSGALIVCASCMVLSTGHKNLQGRQAFTWSCADFHGKLILHAKVAHRYESRVLAMQHGRTFLPSVEWKMIAAAEL